MLSLSLGGSWVVPEQAVLKLSEETYQLQWIMISNKVSVGPVRLKDTQEPSEPLCAASSYFTKLFIYSPGEKDDSHKSLQPKKINAC